MGVSAEDAVNVAGFRVRQGAGSDLRFQPQPSCVDAIKIARERLLPMIELLDLREKKLSNPAYECIIGDEAVELVSVNCEMAFALKFPNVALINRDADQVRHDFGETLVVISLYPNHFDPPLPVRELADLGEEFPVVAIEARKVQVGKDVAEKNEPAIRTGIKNCEGFSGAADVRTEMHIRQEQRVARWCLHT